MRVNDQKLDRDMDMEMDAQVFIAGLSTISCTGTTGLCGQRKSISICKTFLVHVLDEREPKSNFVHKIFKLFGVNDA